VVLVPFGKGCWAISNMLGRTRWPCVLVFHGQLKVLHDTWPCTVLVWIFKICWAGLLILRVWCKRQISPLWWLNARGIKCEKLYRGRWSTARYYYNYYNYYSSLRLIVWSWLDVPTFATGLLHACIQARAPSEGRWNCGREMSGNFA